MKTLQPRKLQSRVLLVRRTRTLIQRHVNSSAKLASVFVVPLFSFLLVSCAGLKDSAPKNFTKKWDEIPDAVPVAVSPSKYGNPDSYEVMGKTYYVMGVRERFEQKGIASWYGTKFHGQRTSSGEDYDMYAMTAAHKTLRIPVFVEVTNLDNGRKAVVKVNDRGPFHEGRIIDLSYAAATKLGVARSGTANVKIRLLNVNDDVKRNENAAIINKNIINKATNNKAIVPLDGPAKPIIADSEKLYVQVAVFSSEKNALAQIEKLQDQGFFDVRLHVEQKKDSALYRVRIGPLPSRNVAENVSALLKENNHHDLRIIKNN